MPTNLFRYYIQFNLLFAHYVGCHHCVKSLCKDIHIRYIFYKEYVNVMFYEIFNLDNRKKTNIQYIDDSTANVHYIVTLLVITQCLC